MIEYKKFNKNDWNKYKKGLMELEEASFNDSELCMDEEETKECMIDMDCYAYIALENGKIIGCTYGNILQEIDKDYFFAGYYDPKTYKHYDKKTLYITSTAVHPDYRGKGIAKQLKYTMFKDLKKYKFEYVIGHSKSGTMTSINEWFNGKSIEVYPHWEGSNETHKLVEVNLKNIPKLLNCVRLKQLKDYDCGIASVAVFFADDHVMNWGENEIDFNLTSEKGISHEDLLYYALKVYGFRLFSSYDNTIDNLKQKIDLNKLIIVNYQDDEEGHYSVVFGYDKSNVYIMNVWSGKEEKIPIRFFENSWYSKLYGYKWMAWF